MAFLFLDKKNVTIGSVILTTIFSLGVIIGYYAHQPAPSISHIGQASSLLDTKDSLVNTLMTDQFSNEKELIKELIAGMHLPMKSAAVKRAKAIGVFII